MSTSGRFVCGGAIKMQYNWDVPDKTDKLDEKMDKLNDKMTEILNMILYAPGGPMYQEAKKNFDSIVH